MATELIDYSSADHFESLEAREQLLRDASVEGDAGYLAHALGVIARAHGMTALERDTGMKRQHLYRALSANGNPTLATVLKALKALGMEMKIEPERNSLSNSASR